MQGRADPQSGGRFGRVGDAEGERRAEIRQFPVQPVQPAQLARVVPVPLDARRQLLIPVAMPAPQGVLLVRLLPSGQAERAHAFQHPVLHRILAGLGRSRTDLSSSELTRSTMSSAIRSPKAQTLSTASSVNPPTNTDSRAHSHCSGFVHRSKTQARHACSVCWRSGAPRRPRRSSRSRSRRRSRTWFGDSTGSQVTASSIANGSPSS